MSIFKLKFGKWVTENRFKELAVSLYNSYCKITWIGVNYSKERLIRWRWWKFRKQSWSTSEQLMPSPRLKVFLLFICSLSFVWFVWSKSHSRNQVKTKFVGELYQFTVINLQVYFFPSKSTRIKRQFFDNHIQFITTKFHNIVWAPDIVENRDSLFYENCKNMRRSFSKQWKTKKHRAGTQFLLLLFKTILQRLGISTLGMDGTSS